MPANVKKDVDLAKSTSYASLQGIGASPGSYTGKVRLVDNTSLHKVERGDVVVCKTTDPSWTSILLLSGAIVAEVGGELSHAAVVARELKVPCIVAAKGATSNLKDGQLVQVNAETGKITPIIKG